MHSYVYRVFWPSGRVVDCFILILFRHSITGPDHPIYRTDVYEQLFPSGPLVFMELSDFKSSVLSNVYNYICTRVRQALYDFSN